MPHLLHLAPYLLGFTLANAQQPAPDPRQASAAKANAVATQITAAETALEQGHFPEAAELLRALALANPKDAHVLYDLGFADERVDSPDHDAADTAARKAYTAALAVDPSMAEAHAALGLLEARDNHPAEAHTHLRAAAQATSATPDLRARSLRALAELDEPTDPAAAREDLLAAIKLTGEQPSDALLTARLAERAGDSAAAEAAFRRTLVSTPGDPDAVSGLAHALSRRGNTAEAIALLEDALRPHAGGNAAESTAAAKVTGAADPRLTSQLAALYAAQGPEGAGKAVALLNDLRAKNAGLAADAALTRQLARLQLVAGNTDEAERLYKALSTTNPKDGPLLDDLGSVYVQQARFAEAEATLQRAVELRTSFASPNDWAEATGHLAFAASRNHHPLSALQALTARATVLPNSAASLFLEAISHDTLHQYKDATRAYKAFLAMAGGKLPDEEFQARHRLTALEHMH